MDSKISCAFDEFGNLFLHRTAESGEIVQSFQIMKHEVITVLIPAMVDNPDYADKMVLDLERQGLARKDHSL